jgi:predicted RNase H-like HicB family nuclease
MQQTFNLKLNILLESKENGGTIASALEFPGYKVEASTRQQALEALQQVLDNHLKTVEIVPLEIQVSYTPISGNPWVKFAGIFKDDVYFAQIADAIRAERESEDDTEVDPSVYER